MCTRTTGKGEGEGGPKVQYRDKRAAHHLCIQEGSSRESHGRWKGENHDQEAPCTEAVAFSGGTQPVLDRGGDQSDKGPDYTSPSSASSSSVALIS